jgi:hypothetical protein
MKKRSPEEITKLQVKTWRMLAGLDECAERYPNWLGHKDKNARIDYGLLKGDTRDNFRKEPPYRKNKGTDSHIYYLRTTLELPVDYAGTDFWIFNRSELEKILIQKGIDLPDTGSYSGADEVSPKAKYFEGATRQVLVNAYERDPRARAACIAHYGDDCCVCGFNFRDIFGDIADGFIHVHHLKQLSDVGKEYEVDPIADLRPVCPNCHAAIHRRSPPYTIEEIKKRRLTRR